MQGKTNAVKLENDSTRSHRAPHYELIPKAAIDRLTLRLEMGEPVHGAQNWRGGGPDFVAETKRHLVAHVLNYIEGDTSDDHLGAILANAAFLAHFEAASK